MPAPHVSARPTAAPATGAADAFEVIAGDEAAGLVLLCDHASNRIPAEYGSLGLPAAELERHIAYDIGAAALTRGLAERFGAPDEAAQDLEPQRAQLGLLAALVGQEEDIGPVHRPDRLHGDEIGTAGADADDQDPAHRPPPR